MVITIAGRKYWLWRAADQEGYVLDEIVQSRRLLMSLLKKQGIGRGAAKRQVMPDVEHRLPETIEANPTSTQFI